MQQQLAITEAIVQLTRKKMKSSEIAAKDVNERNDQIYETLNLMRHTYFRDFRIKRTPQLNSIASCEIGAIKLF